MTRLIARITTPDGRASSVYYNHHSQLTSATGPDQLEMHHESVVNPASDQETAPDGDITATVMIIHTVTLPYATEDATGQPENHDVEHQQVLSSPTVPVM
ncbi:hypothetical protein ACNKHU_24790 [Shigella flexneri]